MRLRHAAFLIVVCFIWGGLASAQEKKTSSCDYADGMEVSVQTGTGREEPHNGKIWMPGGEPMTLFTQTPLVLNYVPIPVGAYTMYVQPDRKNWMLIVSKNVTAGAKYDPAQDLVRAPMQLGEIGQELKDVQVSMVHSAPKVCSLNIYYGKAGAFVEFSEK